MFLLSSHIYDLALPIDSYRAPSVPIRMIHCYNHCSSPSQFRSGTVNSRYLISSACSFASFSHTCMINIYSLGLLYS